MSTYCVKVLFWALFNFAKSLWQLYTSTTTATQHLNMLTHLIKMEAGSAAGGAAGRGVLTKIRWLIIGQLWPGTGGVAPVTSQYRDTGLSGLVTTSVKTVDITMTSASTLAHYANAKQDANATWDASAKIITDCWRLALRIYANQTMPVLYSLI